MGINDEPMGPGGNDPMNPRNSSVPLDGGGDTHIHPFGPNETDFTVTTRLPGGVEIHDNPLDPGNPDTNNFGMGG
jgi:hypothetical protein